MHANGWKWVVQAWKFSRWPFKNSILFVYFWGFVLRGILHVLRHESGGQKRTWESKFSSSTMWVPGMELISSAWQQAPLLAEPTYHLSLTFCKNQSWGGILHDKAHITSVTSIDKASIHATTLSIKISGMFADLKYSSELVESSFSRHHLSPEQTRFCFMSTRTSFFYPAFSFI